MKHESELTTYFSDLAKQAGLDVGPEATATLLAHAEFVLEANERVNLTAIRDPREAIRLHVVDSLLVLPEILAAPEGALLDIGTGAGFPGLPLAVCASRPAVLLDSVGKKVKVVGEFLQQSGLSDTISAVHARAEEFAGSHKAEFAVVVARAVSELPALVELARPLLREGGVFVALKARPEASERERGDAVASLVGMSRVGRRCVAVPGGDEAREILTYTVISRPRVSLPRRTGLAQSKPLA